MKDKQIEKLEREIAELEELNKKKKAGDLSPEERARLDRVIERSNTEVAARAWGSAVVLAVLVGTGVWWWAGADEREAQRQADREAARERAEARHISPSARRSQAAYACTQFVTQTLRAPTTAQFPRDIQSATEVSGGEYTVTGMVDAENAFGAIIRQPYTCRLRLADGDWYRVSVDVGN